MFDFIKQELVEAKMFRTPVVLGGLSASDLARVLYMSLLSIELLRYDDESTARNYAAKTIQYGDFDHMRGSVTDVGNLMAVLSNQSDYEDRIKTNYDVSAPILQTKSYLRGVWQGSFQHGRDRQFFMNLENALNINDSSSYQVRRTVLDWNSANSSERHNALSNIRREFNRHATRLDILEILPKS
jgi:hypothetical protein